MIQKTCVNDRITWTEELSHKASAGIQVRLWLWGSKPSCEGHWWSLCCGFQWAIPQLLFSHVSAFHPVDHFLLFETVHLAFRHPLYWFSICLFFSVYFTSSSSLPPCLNIRVPQSQYLNLFPPPTAAARWSRPGEWFRILTVPKLWLQPSSLFATPQTSGIFTRMPYRHLKWTCLKQNFSFIPPSPQDILFFQGHGTLILLVLWPKTSQPATSPATNPPFTMSSSIQPFPPMAVVPWLVPPCFIPDLLPQVCFPPRVQTRALNLHCPG